MTSGLLNLFSSSARGAKARPLPIRADTDRPLSTCFLSLTSPYVSKIPAKHRMVLFWFCNGVCGNPKGEMWENPHSALFHSITHWNVFIHKTLSFISLLIIIAHIDQVIDPNISVSSPVCHNQYFYRNCISIFFGGEVVLVLMGIIMLSTGMW